MRSAVRAWGGVVALWALGLGGCADDGQGEVGAGAVSFDLSLAPPEARCAVVTVKPSTGSIVTRTFELAPGQSTHFSLTGLPLGNVTLTEDVYVVGCTQIAGQGVVWTSDPVMVMLKAGVTMDITFVLRRTDSAGQVNVRTDFPNPDTAPVFAEFAVAAMTVPEQITAGPDGNFWFTAPSTDVIGKITPAGVVTEFALTAGRQPKAITSGPDGALWFTQAGVAKIGRIATSGAVREFDIPSGSVALGITSGVDGNLWFTSVDRLGRLSPTGAMTEFFVPGDPKQITIGSDGSVWFTATGPAYIGRYVPSTARLTPFRVFAAVPEAIAPGSDGALWFTQPVGGIGRIAIDGTMTFYASPGLLQAPQFITPGPDGALWFTDSATGTIGRITTAGVIRAFLTPSPSAPRGITVGEGGLWYADQQGRIGRVRP